MTREMSDSQIKEMKLEFIRAHSAVELDAVSNSKEALKHYRLCMKRHGHRWSVDEGEKEKKRNAVIRMVSIYNDRNQHGSALKLFRRFDQIQSMNWH